MASKKQKTKAVKAKSCRVTESDKAGAMAGEMLEQMITGPKYDFTVPTIRTNKISRAYRQMLSEVDQLSGLTGAQILARTIFRVAIAGGPSSVGAARELREVTEGKLPQTFKIDGVIGTTDLQSATDEQLDRVISAYIQRKGNGRVEERVIPALAGKIADVTASAGD